MANSIGFPGITSINDAVFEEQLTENLISFFNWNLLGVGAFFNIKRPTARSKFYPVDTDRKIWENSRGNWVWESGVPFVALQPIQVSGVYVDNAFIPNDADDYHLNYPDGQIIFDDPIPSSSIVEMNFSFRKFNFYEVDEDWFQQVVFDPLPESGVREIFAENRIYLPAVIVEPAGNISMYGYQLGDNTVVEDQIVLFHILADHDQDRDKMVRILNSMYNRTIWLYDTNKVADANKFPLTPEGSISSESLSYPELVDQFMYKRCTFTSVRPQDITPQLPLFRAVVRATIRVLMP